MEFTGNPGEVDGNEANTKDLLSNFKKCHFCEATKTPRWRTGPLGPQTLCNACGLRFWKLNRVQLQPDSTSSSSTNAQQGQGQGATQGPERNSNTATPHALGLHSFR